jgi:hypothetical protein
MMSDRPKDRKPPHNPDSLINFSEVAATDRPRAPSLDEERAERDRARRQENEDAAAAAGGNPPMTPPD